MKIAFLWTGLSGYMNACLRELSSPEGVELFVSHELPAKDAPYEEGQFAWLPNRMAWRTKVDSEQLEKTLSAFQPDIMVMPSWHIGLSASGAKICESRMARNGNGQPLAWKSEAARWNIDLTFLCSTDHGYRLATGRKAGDLCAKAWFLAKTNYAGLFYL